jgi:hypothetical protein
MIKRTALFILMICFLSILIHCGGSSEKSVGSSEVSISAIFIKSDSSLLKASALTHIRFMVTGPGMPALTGTVPVQGDIVEFILNVPNGPQRHFLIEALDGDQVRYSGEADRDLDGRPITIVIELIERILDVSGDWLFYRTTLGDTQEIGPFCRRIMQTDDSLSVIGYEPEIGEIKGTGTIRGHNVDLTLSFIACDNQATITIAATTDGNTMSGTFSATGGCLDTPITGSWRAERGECSLPKAEVSVRIAHFQDGYSLDFFADEVSAQIASATVTGPQIELLNLNYTCSIGSCRWFAIAPFGQTKPTPGDTYTFNLQYSDGTSEILTDSVYDIGVGFPTLLSPQDGETVETTTPTFSWQAPDWGCASWYHLIVFDSTGNEIWWPAIPGDTTSAVYNFDGMATQPLTTGESYSWSVNAFDDCEHLHPGHNNFAGAHGGIFTVSGGVVTYNVAEYFPLGIEDTWTYLEDTSDYFTSTVTETVIIDGVEAKKLHDDYGDDGSYNLFTIDTIGLRKYEFYEYDTADDSWERQIYDPPITILPAEVSIGTVQNFDATVYYSDSNDLSTTGTISGNMTVEGIEDVTVPAGIFVDCLRLKLTQIFTFSDGSHSYSYADEVTIWIARGVGIVRSRGSGEYAIDGEVVNTDAWGDVLVSATVGGVSYPVSP